MIINISPLSPKDRESWGVLWQAYLTYYQTDLNAHVTQTTWARLMDTEFGMYGFGAKNTQGELVGFVHYLFHPVRQCTHRLRPKWSSICENMLGKG